MRINNVFQGRPDFYDRSPLSVGAGTTTIAAAPHADTDRNVYTVPSNRKAFLSYGLAVTIRETAAAPVGRRQAHVYVSDTVNAPNFIDAFSLGNAVADQVAQASPGGAILLAGHSVHTADGDLSTGGTCDYEVTFRVIEYDA